ncbi:hypothetical protein T10_414 [Trichinella papuae]|uniref:Uncharacterized protein n=1 Tax=Trichinella papuae TaxID=268474 RepID=A0A0V1M201_9BILA|nr:hypothetical protein T10_414 [Trichinella papuae]
MVRKEMSETSWIPAERKLAASKTRLKIMLQGLNRMYEESEKAVVIKGHLLLEALPRDRRSSISV